MSKLLEEMLETVCNSRTSTPTNPPSPSITAIIADPSGNDVEIILNNSIKGQEVLQSYKKTFETG